MTPLTCLSQRYPGSFSWKYTMVATSVLPRLSPIIWYQRFLQIVQRTGTVDVLHDHGQQKLEEWNRNPQIWGGKAPHFYFQMQCLRNASCCTWALRMENTKHHFHKCLFNNTTYFVLWDYPWWTRSDPKRFGTCRKELQFAQHDGRIPHGASLMWTVNIQVLKNGFHWLPNSDGGQRRIKKVTRSTFIHIPRLYIVQTYFNVCLLDPVL